MTQEEKALASEHYSKGATYAIKEEYEKAIEEYNKAIELNPQSIEARLGLGYIYLRKKRYSEARGIFQTILRIDPQNINAKRHLLQLDELEGKHRK